MVQSNVLFSLNISDTEYTFHMYFHFFPIFFQQFCLRLFPCDYFLFQLKLQIECATTIMCAKKNAFLIFTTRTYLYACIRELFYCVYWNCMNIEHAYHFHCNTLFKHILLYLLMKDRRKSQYTECLIKCKKKEQALPLFFGKEMILNL